jgi:hypothetical protein
MEGKDTNILEGLELARLIEYSITFFITMMVSIFVIYRTKCQLQNFSIYVMVILIFS